MAKKISKRVEGYTLSITYNKRTGIVDKVIRALKQTKANLLQEEIACGSVGRNMYTHKHILVQIESERVMKNICGLIGEKFSNSVKKYSKEIFVIDNKLCQI